MRILYVNKISPLTGGGAELRLWHVARGLAARGHSVDIVCGRNQPTLPPSHTVDGVRLVNLSLLPPWLFRFNTLSFFLARYLFYLRSIPVLLRAARRYDVVMDCASPVVSIAGVAARRAGVPSAVTVYETFGRRWFRLKGPVTAVLGYLAELALYRTTYDGYITLSRETFRDLVRAGKPPAAVYHLSRGVGVHLPPDRVPGAMPRPPQLVCISRFVKQKNLGALLRVFAEVLRSHPEATLCLIGDGPERAALERAAAELDVLRATRFEGRASDEQKWQLLQGSSIFVFPSLQEGFGIVLLEAMAAGLPVVGYDLPVFREFIVDGEHGFLVEPHDERAMAQRVRFLLDNPGMRAGIGDANAEYARSFTWENAVGQEEMVLRRLVRDNG